MPKMINHLHENHQGGANLTLLSVIYVLNVLNVPNVLNVLNMPKNASLACWALFTCYLRSSVIKRSLGKG